MRTVVVGFGQEHASAEREHQVEAVVEHREAPRQQPAVQPRADHEHGRQLHPVAPVDHRDAEREPEQDLGPPAEESAAAFVGREAVHRVKGYAGAQYRVDDQLMVERNAATANPAAAASPACRPAPRTAIGTISLTHTTIIAPAAIDWMMAMSVGVGRASELRSPTSPATNADRDDRREPQQHLAQRDATREQRRRDADRVGEVRQEHRADERDRHVPPPSSVRPMAIDSGMPSSTMPTVRLRAAVASAPAGTAASPAESSASSTGSSGSSRSARAVEPRGERVVADRADEQADAGRVRGRPRRTPAHEVGGDRTDERAGAERHHETEPPRLGQLREAGDEQRADEQRRLAERCPQPCFEHETGVSRCRSAINQRGVRRPGARAARMRRQHHS